jgi:hypothetical protein
MDYFTEMLSMQYSLRDKLLGFNYPGGETEETAQRHEQYVSVAKLVSQATKDPIISAPENG